MELVEVRKDLVWTHEALSSYEWLQPLLDVPDNASVPLAMTPPHPEAVGSYGADAIAWVASELGVELRWWQRLAFTRQLEHRADGSLCWRIILESGPRRIGKSVRLRSMALWRLAHSDLFGEKQLALHTGKDLPIVREIHRQAWRWAQEREGWDVKRGVGQEEVYWDEHRWLVRSTDSVYGYDVCLGMVDEAWAVDPATFDEGLEPATMERQSPQLLLTSTAHRRATSLMKKRIADSLAFDDGETLLLLWGVLDASAAGDPETWKAASPHWSRDREKMIAAKYEKAINGEVDPLSGDPDPMESFLGQYLCRWDMRPTSASSVGDEVISERAWAELAGVAPATPPDAVAVEAWFERGVSLAEAWRATDGRVTVRVTDFASLDDVARHLATLQLRRPAIVGTSLMDHPAWRANKVRTESASATTVSQVGELQRVLREGTLRHDGSEVLAEQVLALRVSPGVNGPRIRSTERADAIKAAMWAASAAATVVRRKVIVPTRYQSA
jgi:hypothetical protein